MPSRKCLENRRPSHVAMGRSCGAFRYIPDDAIQLTPTKRKTTTKTDGFPFLSKIARLNRGLASTEASVIIMCECF
jgi:hypothetical protein